MSIFECHSAKNRRIGDRDQREGGNDAALLFVLERRFGSLFNRNAFREIARLVDVGALEDGDVIRQ